MLYFLMGLIIIALSTTSIFYFFHFKKIEKKYSKIINLQSEYDSLEDAYKKLRKQYSNAHTEYKKLDEKRRILNDEATFTDLGMVSIIPKNATASQYEAQYENIKKRRSMWTEEKAVIGGKKFMQEGDAKLKGKLLKSARRMIMTWFNNEITLVMPKQKINMNTIGKKIEIKANNVNRLGKVFDLEISRDYIELVKQEIYTHQITNDLEAKDKAKIKEQKKAAQKAERDAERDAEKINSILSEKHLLLTKANEEEKERLISEIKELNEKLRHAIEKRERAKSNAELTKAGHVYVISNVGSFGKDVYKIGVSRRDDPQDRIDELGSASVPFIFDRHTLLFSENAIELEAKLHAALDEYRVNRANIKKEFFKVPFEKIKEEINRIYKGQAIFTDTPDAHEYKETLIKSKDIEIYQKLFEETEFFGTDDLFDKSIKAEESLKDAT